MNQLRNDIIELEDFLPEDIFREALRFGESHVANRNQKYDGEMAPLDPEFIGKILGLLRARGFTYVAESARLRIGMADDLSKLTSLVHVDHQCHRVLVIYLENSLYLDPSRAGTIFWEHSVTKKKKIDLQNPRAVFLHDHILHRDTIDLGKWTEWLHCPFVVNSALLFDGLYFHSPPHPAWEKSGPGRRITLDLFLNEG